MDIEIVRAAHPIKAGQVVHTTGSPITPTPPAVKPITVTVPAVEELHTIPFFGVALESANDPGDSVKVQIGGALSEHLGRGRFGAVGINSSGQLVRAGDRECVSAPNWIGDCDDSGTVTIRPRRDTRLSVLDFGAMGNGKDDERADDTDAIQGALDCAMRLGGTTDGKVVYLPPGDYRIKRPLVISNGCILEGAGLARGDETSRILADVKSGDFNLSTRTGIGKVGGEREGETVYCAIALVGYETGSAMKPPRGRADYSALRQFALHSIPAQGRHLPPFPVHQAPQMDGVRVMATGAFIERMSVVSFRRNGIEVSSTEIAPTVNVGLVQIRDCLLTSNGEHGLDIGSLGNSNASTMLVMDVSATDNGRDGIHDHSYLGCTFVSCHTAGNRHRNYSCENNAPQYAVYIGCYAEEDAPSVFKGGSIAVVGGDMDITSDSTYWGYGAYNKGPSTLKVANNYSKYPRYWITKAGVDIEEGELQTPGNGYVYRAVHAGHTSGKNGKPPDGMPDFPKGIGQTIEELDRLVWKCEGEYRTEVSTFNNLGSAADSTIIQDYGSVTPDGQGTSLFRIQVQTAPDAIKGRIETSLVHPADRHTYYQTAYENGPVPGALMLPEAWIGNYVHGERRIAVVHGGTPWNVPVGSCNFYSPGDLLLNATGATARQGEIGWAVKAPCGRRSAASAWAHGTHYRIGEIVRPANLNGFVYRLVAYTGGPSNQLRKVSGEQEPQSWQQPGPGQSVGGLTSDHHLQWQTIYDLDAKPGLIEPLPQRATGQSDSKATDIAQLKADFNALLAKMRSANLLE
ncbi:glycoside hydrolase family 55 protein [Kitasatospora sp. NBC_00374]|uniref:glycosyl hydrolase family 28-related protein n=1 Tax=Kitasatospora sp. NBC_00374 TaxID=2975964 RepID=UPI003251481C